MVSFCHHTAANETPLAHTQPTSHCQQSASTETQFYAQTNQLIATLSQPPTHTRARQTALKDARKQARLSTDPAAYFLSDQATLILAATAIRDNDFHHAREQLREIPLSSSVAVQAGLLFAESWRLDNQPEQALRWFLRIAAAFPADPQALEGLLAAANDARLSQQLELASALYNRVLTLSEVSAQSANALTDEIDHLGIALLSSNTLSHGASTGIELSSDNGASLEATRQQFIRVALAHPSIDVIGTRRTEKSSLKEAKCLSAHQQALTRHLAELRLTLVAFSEQKKYMANSIERDQQHFNQLTSQLRPHQMSAEQIKIRQNMTTLRNRIARQRTQLNFFDQTMANLPSMVENAEAEIALLLTQRINVYDQAKIELQAALHESAAALQATYLNLSAESHAGLARLHEAHR